MRTSILLVTLALAASVVAADKSDVLIPGMAAPKLEVGTVIKGKVPKIDDGGIHVVEFWATWCGPCRATIPHITELAKKYNGKVTFTGVSVWERGDDTLAQVKSFVAEMGAKMDYNIVTDSAEEFMAKNWMTAAKQDGIPASFIIGRDGKVAWIGHPTKLDDVLPKVLDGTFDVAAELAKTNAGRSELQVLLVPYTDAVREKDPARALQELDKLIAARPDLLDRVGMLKFRFLMSRDPAEGLAYAKEVSEGGLKDNGLMLVNLAWMLIDEPGQFKVHDYALAAAIAERAAKVEKKYSYTAMGLVGQAKFKAGDKEGAIAALELAIRQAKAGDADPKLIQQFEQKLAEYRK